MTKLGIGVGLLAAVFLPAGAQTIDIVISGA
jgi:sorbitol-specific phosphotransferase system component IIBC